MYLIWSNEHRAWWKPNSCGYTTNIIEAGTYSQVQMAEIVQGATFDWTEAPNEVPVRVSDIPAAAQDWLAR